MDLPVDLCIEFTTSDFIVCSFNNILYGFILYPLCNIPCYVIFQKLTPLNVETTMIAFAASLMNLAYGVIGTFVGVGFNLIVGVTKDDLSNYWILKCINLFFYVPYQLVFIWMIPLKS